MQLVLLAAGHGRRFGGLKQLAPVGPKGEALMDYTAGCAAACGFAGVVVIVREEIRDEIAGHIAARWPRALPVELVVQAPVPGTAQAVLSARPAISEPFVVANADDLYGNEAIAALVSPLATTSPASNGHRPERPHVLVGYRLNRTVLTPAPVTRGICEVDDSGALRQIVEHTVQRLEDGTFLGKPAGSDLAMRPLTGRERVSMNLWRFEVRIFDLLAEAIASFDPARAVRPELVLPDVVNALVITGRDAVQVVGTGARCIGVTHQEDMALVRSEISRAEETSLSSPAI
ncbi:MAG: NTP transferase domain-containing protein [Actinomycetota bacterium]|nr:NTP transferase domain-containing protein [Actinomycetota bacterium]